MVVKKTLVISVLFICLTLIPAIGFSDDVKIEVVPVTDQIYMIVGQGGNIGLFVGEDGTFLIDDQFAPLTEKILEAIKSVGGQHPRFLINTHYHGDHTGGNENLGQGGTLIVSHDNVRERLISGAYIGAFKMKLPPTAKFGLPVVTFSRGIKFHLNGDTVIVKHLPHAHTDGDSLIYFQASNVIHAGDLFFNGFYPFIDVNHGGSLKGMLKGVDKVLRMADDQTKIISGHGPLGDKQQLMSYRKMLGIAYDRLSTLKAEGKSAEEAVAAKPLADLEPTWGNGIFKSDQWIKLIYSGV
jgi:glyoxylase-like metal-dependent hydrolase (beta-lactamase superfamily II)